MPTLRSKSPTISTPPTPAAAGRPATVVVIGTGGTIAGTTARPQDQLGYQAGALSAQALVAGLPALAGQDIEVESLAQLDSCDMDHATWLRLALVVKRHLARRSVAGVVITHGTDTLEETAFFLHHTLAASKPVVLTAAMRPATAPSPDGPQNLLDAVMLARHTGARGVLVVLGGDVHGADALRKVHGWRVDAFSSGDAALLGRVQDGRLRLLREWPTRAPAHAAVLKTNPNQWPVVDIVTSHAGARGVVVDALVAAGARGLIIAGTGNGSVHTDLQAAARRVIAQGVVVRRASRCTAGGVVVAKSGGKPGALPAAGDATPAQARVKLLLELVGSAAQAAKPPAAARRTRPPKRLPERQR